MHKLIWILLFIFLPSSLIAHPSHYLDFKKIEMEFLKDDKVIGYNFYFFNKQDNVLTVKNQIQFKVDLFGIKVFNFEGY